jgi:hypothetical protein
MTETELFVQEIVKIVKEARLEERRRACDIVRNLEVYSPYIVAKYAIQARKDTVIKEIMGEETDACQEVMTRQFERMYW